MAESRAEIQRAYRERQKQKNKDEYLRQERDRKNRSYVPTAELSENDKKKRRQRNRNNLRKFCERKRQQRSRKSSQNSIGSFESSNENNEPGPSSDRGRLRVRLDFGNRSEGKRKGAIKRWKRDMSDAFSRIRLLEQERKKLLTKVKTTQRNMQRMKQKLNKSKEKELTPSKQTEQIMKEANLSEEQKTKLRKTLLTGNALIREIAESRKQTPKGKMTAVHRIVSSRIIKKYKCIKALADKTGLCRHKLGKSENKKYLVEKAIRRTKVKQQSKKVVDFLKREDNSRTLPGKNDAKRLKKGVKVQSHVLTDYLGNLYMKYKTENFGSSLSFASFCRCRPDYILKTAFTSRLSCLCTKHQNAALTLKVLKKAGMNVAANPEKAVENMPSAETMMKDLDDMVSVSQWKRVEVEDRGKKKSVTRIVEGNMEKDKYIKHAETQMKEFREHIDRMKNQYEQMRTLKSNLPEHHMIIQIDFAENYSCRSLEEVQSAYFNQTSVTIHPMVVYFKTESGELTHKSFVTISGEISHKAATVVAFIEDLMPELMKIDKDLHTLQYWSDSPSSQYRNRYIFNLIENHKQKFGVWARWNNWESGHGKGPCDGLGGSCKRLADEYIRSGKAIIQDAKDFYDWALSSNMKNVAFRFVDSKVCQQKDKELSQTKLQPVAGTMKIHATVCQDTNILTRETSCYCAHCLEGVNCNSWKSTTTVKGEDKKTNAKNDNEGKQPIESEVDENSNTKETNMSNPNNDQNPIPNKDKNVNVGTHQLNYMYTIGDFVAAAYENKCFIGKIADEDEAELNLTLWRKGRAFTSGQETKIFCGLKSQMFFLK